VNPGAAAAAHDADLFGDLRSNIEPCFDADPGANGDEPRTRRLASPPTDDDKRRAREELDDEPERGRGRGVDPELEAEVRRILARERGGEDHDDGDPYGLAAWRIDWPKFWNQERTDADFLVEPILARGRGHAFVAPAKAGKTLLFQELALALATGRAVLHRPASDPITVVYLDMEMTEDDLYERASDFGYGPDDDLSRLHYILLPSLPPLDTPEGGAALLEYVHDVNADVVIIDTLARSVAGPESDADTLRAFFRHTGQPLKTAGVTWARADNLGKDPTRGARGTSAKNDDVDVVWQLTRGDASLKLHATHRRIRWAPETVALAIVEEPHLHHRPAERTWPPGTLEAAAKLDQAGVPLDTTKRDAGKALRAAGLSASNDAITGALRWRRERPPEQLEMR
jgi:hypothetical protein